MNNHIEINYHKVPLSALMIEQYELINHNPLIKNTLNLKFKCVFLYIYLQNKTKIKMFYCIIRNI